MKYYLGLCGVLMVLHLSANLYARDTRGEVAPAKSRIIFVDTFEAGNIEDRWLLGKKSTVKINYDRRNVHSGRRSMEVVTLPGQDAGGGATIWFMPGYDKVHVRWYCKFDAQFDQGDLMHLSKVVAGRDKWGGYGTAGKKPSGSDFFRTGLDPWRDWGHNPPPGEAVLYSYFPEMSIDQRTGKYWGNLSKAEPKVLLKPGKWHCLEIMLKANHAGMRDGEQAFWVDGKLAGHFKDMVWRQSNNLKVNSLWLGLYIHDNKKFNRVWFDDVIVSLGYIGR